MYVYENHKTMIESIKQQLTRDIERLEARRSKLTKRSHEYLSLSGQLSGLGTALYYMTDYIIREEEEAGGQTTLTVESNS